MFDRLFGKKPSDAPKRDVPQSQKQAPSSTPPTPSAAHPPPPSDPTKTIHELDDKLVTMDLRIAKLEKQVEDEVEKAKALLAQEKRPAALQCMKRKKMYEEQVGQLMAQRANIEQMKFTLETAAMNAEVLRAQRAAGNEMARLNAGMNADTIEEDLEKVRETMEEARNIGQMLGEPMGEVHDDDELLDELNELCATGPQAAAAGPVKQTAAEPLPVLPTVPTAAVGKPVAAKKPAYSEEDEELLRQLQSA